MIYPNQAQTADSVALHYDELDPFYREIWGLHVHHGLWTTGRETPAEAVVALIDHLAGQLDFRPGHRVCDVGCGYGATAVRLAERHGVAVTGVTISEVQAAHARESTRDVPAIEIQCQNWLTNHFADEAFDRIYAIESSEHMEDKPRFFREIARTLRPGGRGGICAWLGGERARPWEIKHLLEPICREARLPGMGTEIDYRTMAAEAGLRILEVEDLSRRVRRTWSVCARRVAVKLATDPTYRSFVRDKGAANRVFVLTLARLALAYRTGAMRYCLIVLQKPPTESIKEIPSEA